MNDDKLLAQILSQIFEIDPENEIDSVQSERGSVYGKYIVNAKAREEILSILISVFKSKNGDDSELPDGFLSVLSDLVAKLVRLAASPKHRDSILDLQSYANLWLKIIDKGE